MVDWTVSTIAKLIIIVILAVLIIFFLYMYLGPEGGSVAAIDKIWGGIIPSS